MVRIKKAMPLENYRLKITFDTNEEGIFDVGEWLDGPVFQKLKDKEFFNHVMIDEIPGTICWPNGVDFCPDMVYENTKFED